MHVCTNTVLPMPVAHCIATTTHLVAQVGQQPLLVVPLLLLGPEVLAVEPQHSHQLAQPLLNLR
jgi:hypothetical protein